MKSRITKLTAVAAVIAVFLGGISLWPAGSGGDGEWWLGPSAVWGQEILATLDTIKGISCREQTVFVMPDGSTHTSSTWNILFVSNDSYRRDIYDGEELREVQWYVPDGNGMVQTGYRLDLRSYFAERHEGSFGNHDPVERIRSYVRVLEQTEDKKFLGERSIKGHNCVGYEISASLYGSDSQHWLTRIWFDVEAKLPRVIERERPYENDETNLPFAAWIDVQDEFDYNPDLPADTFIPEIPEGFVFGHPDDIQAARQNQQNEQ